ncbi:ArgK-domain-containing protein [Linderina pennispora]|uniref:ArgK-domain-containing protein n=1 Tax=Linderina pennispora TaxID=61395 RepID=A0A1Y1W147_9FUNG|nr:ArgK-domain-containing protein [Linderina pennispora]ORX67230.1 ArgK-domain-containing protein [Linderina pennispora]
MVFAVDLADGKKIKKLHVISAGAWDRKERDADIVFSTLQLLFSTQLSINILPRFFNLTVLFICFFLEMLSQLTQNVAKVVRTATSSGLSRKHLSTQRDSLFEGIRNGDRASLARGITLVESTRRDHQKQARKLVSECIKLDRPRSLRIGLTGTPGVGKSTFIEKFGMMLINMGHRVSVLAVDPSSSRSGGSILGDKTRMQDLSVADGAYVRPSPNSGSLGGVARNTLDSIILTEAAGYDICLVETVGVGQSETMVADMVDMFILLLQPGSGDELQGVKRGIMELADLIIINKADGALEIPAKLTRTEITNALHLMIPRRKSWNPKVVRASAVTGFNLERVWSTIETYFKKLGESGEWDGLRAEQQEKWMWREVTNLLLSRLNRDPETRFFAKSLESDVVSGQLPPGVAAEQIVDQVSVVASEAAAHLEPHLYSLTSEFYY